MVAHMVASTLMGRSRRGHHGRLPFLLVEHRGVTSWATAIDCLAKGAEPGSTHRTDSRARHHEPDLEQVQDDADYLAALGRPATEFLPDRSRSLICRNDSPDVGFEVSLNPYRGCEHGCIYCYIHPTKCSFSSVSRD